MCYVIQALADTFFGIGARSDIEQALIGCGVLHNGGGFSVYREHYRAFSFLKLLHEVPGGSAECGQRLDVARDINHMHPRLLAPY
jgi:hypothetical protein